MHHQRCDQHRAHVEEAEKRQPQVQIVEANHGVNSCSGATSRSTRRTSLPSVVSTQAMGEATWRMIFSMSLCSSIRWSSLLMISAICACIIVLLSCVTGTARDAGGGGPPHWTKSNGFAWQRGGCAETNRSAVRHSQMRLRHR